MARFFIHMAFDGSNYSGWQFQPNALTVQQVIEHALSTLLKENISVIGAGRTDTGVHASQFVAHFDLKADRDIQDGIPIKIPDPTSGQFVFKLNRFLPADIVIYKIEEVDKDLHARFSAISRTYHYHLSSIKPLFNRNYSHYIYGELDNEAINSCCNVILDTRDFTSFAKLHTNVKTNLCKVSAARWNQTEQGYLFEIRADRFLRNMVRSLTGTLLDVGLGKLDVAGFKNIVESKDRQKAGSSAPAKGLVLVHIEYEPQ